MSRLLCSILPEQFLDLRLLKELDDSGFVDRLYQK